MNWSGVLKIIFLDELFAEIVLVDKTKLGVNCTIELKEYLQYKGWLIMAKTESTESSFSGSLVV